MRERGRPSKYDFEQLDALVDEYLATCYDEYKTDKFPDGTTKTRFITKVPTYEGFMIFANIARSTLYDWKDEHKEFSDSLDRILIRQKEVLFNKSLSGEYNATIAKLGLSSNHGMKERTDTTSDDKPIQSNTIIIKKMDSDETNS